MRYLKATLLLGLLTVVIVAGLYEVGAFARMDAALFNAYGRIALPPAKRSWVQYVLIVLVAFGVTWSTIDIARLALKIVVAAVTFTEVLIASWVFSLFNVYFSPFAPALAAVVAFGVSVIYARSGAGQRKRMLRNMFGDRLSRKTFYALVNSDLPVSFEGEMRDATVVVCEIFNHDELMDALPTSDYVSMANLFLRTGGDFLVDAGGYLDECDGESLRAIFGAPLPDKNHAGTACAAAMQLVQRLDNLNRECESRWHKMLDFRVGINSGEMVTAAYGSRRLGTFSVAGEPVEFARRLCSANVIYGSRILIGSCTLEFASEQIEVRPMELVRTRDERSREEVYELLAPKDVLSEEDLQRRDLFWKGVVYYREQLWDEALQHFRAAMSTNGSDPPIEFYIRRIERMRSGAALLEWQSARF